MITEEDRNDPKKKEKKPASKGITDYSLHLLAFLQFFFVLAKANPGGEVMIAYETTEDQRHKIELPKVLADALTNNEYEKIRHGHYYNIIYQRLGINNGRYCIIGDDAWGISMETLLMFINEVLKRPAFKGKKVSIQELAVALGSAVDDPSIAKQSIAFNIMMVASYGPLHERKKLRENGELPDEKEDGVYKGSDGFESPFIYETRNPEKLKEILLSEAKALVEEFDFNKKMNLVDERDPRKNLAKQLNNEIILRLMLQIQVLAFLPGVTPKYSLVFLGKQGIGKSYFAENIVPNDCHMIGSSDILSPKKALDNAALLSGVLVVELPDPKRQDLEHFKSTVTSNHIRYRQHYTHNVRTFMRQQTFIFTSNELVVPISDITGARRILILESHNEYLKPFTCDFAEFSRQFHARCRDYLERLYDVLEFKYQDAGPDKERKIREELQKLFTMPETLHADDDSQETMYVWKELEQRYEDYRPEDSVFEQVGDLFDPDRGSVFKGNYDKDRSYWIKSIDVGNYLKRSDPSFNKHRHMPQMGLFMQKYGWTSVRSKIRYPGNEEVYKIYILPKQGEQAPLSVTRDNLEEWEHLFYTEYEGEGKTF